MSKFDMWDFAKQERIFTDEERSEIWDFIKKAGQGKYTEKEVKEFCAALNRVIGEKECV